MLGATMSWENQILVWEETNHSWDRFGEVASAPVFDDDSLHAKPVAIWKQQNLSEIIKNITDAASNGLDYIQDPDSFSGFLLAVSALNLFPLHIKIVKEDKHADKFLELIHEEENGEEFFLTSELEKSPEIDHLIEYFVKNGLLSIDNDRLIIQGRVPNRAFLKS